MLSGRWGGQRVKVLYRSLGTIRYHLPARGPVTTLVIRSLPQFVAWRDPGPGPGIPDHDPDHDPDPRPVILPMEQRRPRRAARTYSEALSQWRRVPWWWTLALAELARVLPGTQAVSLALLKSPLSWE
jgi:hypothetical protein